MKQKVFGFTLTSVLIAVLIAFLLAPAASAQGWRVEGFAGWYNPDGNVADDDVALGFRVGYDFSEKFGLELTGEFFDGKLENFASQAEQNRYDLSLGTWDASLIWYPGGGDFYLLGGLGWSTVDLEVYIPGEDNNFKGDDTVVAWHVGLGYFWEFENGFYIRPDMRARWMDQNLENSSDGNQNTTFSYDNVDFGLYLGFGYSF